MNRFVRIARVRVVLRALLLVALLSGGLLPDVGGGRRVAAQGGEASAALFLPVIGSYQLEPTCRPTAITGEVKAEVYGGRETAVKGWPCVAAIVYNGEPNVYLGQYCGGTLIAPRWVLTAAHCVDEFAPIQVDVVLGRHRLVQTGGEKIHAQDFEVHPAFNRETNQHDIALILLEEASGYLSAQIVDQGDTVLMKARDMGTVVGWGRAEFGFPYELREAEVPVVSNRDCNELWFGLVRDTMLSAGKIEPHYSGACFGDSGGPLFVRNMERNGWEQIGVVSWGNARCAGNYGVFTRLNQYTDWVQQTICLHTPDEALCRGDEYERDDSPNSAQPITVDGGYQKRYFHDAGDADWVKVEAEAGMRYRVQTSYLEYRGDTVLDLYDADGETHLDTDDNGGEGMASRLTWTAPISQTYFIRVRQKGMEHGLNTRYYLSVHTVP